MWGMTLPVILLLIVGYLQWQSVRNYRASREWVMHTRTILLNLEALLSDLNVAETGQRGYLLTHKESYLKPYDEAVARSRDHLQNLRQLTLDDPVQQGYLDRLGPLVDGKLAEMARTVTLEKRLDHAGAVGIVMTDSGQNDMDQIRADLTDMHAMERGLLQQSEEAYQNAARINSDLSILLIVIGIGFILLIFVLLRRLQHMQEMIKICAWSKLIEYEGEWMSIEDYLTRRFNVQITHGMSDVEAKKMLRLIQEEKPRKAA